MKAEIILDIGKEVVNGAYSIDVFFVPFMLIAMIVPMILIFIFDKKTDGSGFGFFGRFIFKIFGRKTER